MTTDFAIQLADSNMRHIKWIQGNPSPEILTTNDLPILYSTDKLFARKFDWQIDRNVILELQKHVLLEE